MTSILPPKLKVSGPRDKILGILTAQRSAAQLVASVTPAGFQPLSTLSPVCVCRGGCAQARMPPRLQAA